MSILWRPRLDDINGKRKLRIQDLAYHAKYIEIHLPVLIQSDGTWAIACGVSHMVNVPCLDIHEVLTFECFFSGFSGKQGAQIPKTTPRIHHELAEQAVPLWCSCVLKYIATSMSPTRSAPLIWSTSIKSVWDIWVSDGSLVPWAGTSLLFRNSSATLPTSAGSKSSAASWKMLMAWLMSHHLFGGGRTTTRIYMPCVTANGPRPWILQRCLLWKTKQFSGCHSQYAAVRVK